MDKMESSYRQYIGRLIKDATSELYLITDVCKDINWPPYAFIYVAMADPTHASRVGCEWVFTNANVVIL